MYSRTEFSELLATVDSCWFWVLTPSLTCHCWVLLWRWRSVIVIF